ncbi:DC-STAMP domain-containing protein 2-like [Argopecten irradians]|uniref:DC-STAMP domain-containing protein 2-like n=1 Tax=Argopecten irradians TaxID=31199 RepID=UPI0037241C0F
MLPQNVQLVEFLRSEIVHACKAKGQEADHCIESYFNRSRRGVLDNICTVLDISGLCGAIDIGGPVCDILDTFTNLANESVQEVKNLLDKITNFFVFGLNTTFDISGDINSSQTAEQIVDNVKADIVSKTDVILYYAKIIGQVLACSLILLLLKSFLYLHKWRAKEAFDNIYITKEFARYDEKRKKAGKEHVLPLKHREKRKYIVTRSILMAPTELETCQKGAVMIMRSLLIATIIIAIDYALYFLLVLIDTYGNINVNVSGTSTVTLTVEGNSIMAIVLRQLASAIAIDYDYSIDFNMTYCLPNAHEPDTSTIYLVVFLYLLAFVMMFMQAYGLRIRRKVAAHYYPEVEFDRIQYLHSKIRIKRRTLIGWIAHFLTSRRKEKDVSERMTLGSWFYYSCPYMASVFDCKPAKTICLNCDRESDGLMKFNICQTKGCESVYCSPCFKEMDERCPVCNKKYNF